MKLTVLGLGHMGQQIAGRLLDAGHEVTVWNRSPGKAGGLVERGATEAGSVDEAVTGAEVVLSSLTGDEAVEDVLLRDGAARDALAGCVVECSTISPALAGRLAEAYAGRFVACPMAGAPSVVAAGHALLIVSGEPGAVARAEPVLSALSDKRHDAGTDPTRAAKVKLLNNYLLLGNLAVLADAVAAASAAGFDGEYLADLLRSLPTVPPALTGRIDQLVRHEHPAAFSVDLGRKDLRLFAEVFGSGSIAAAVAARYDAAAGDGLGADDISAVIEAVRTG